MREDADGLTIEALMQKAHGGDSRAYARALRLSAGMLRGFVARRVPPASVEDVIQEILVSIHKSRHTYDGKRPYAPWLFAIAQYRVADYLRGAYRDHLRNAAPIEDFEENMAGDVTETTNMHEYIEKAAMLLPEKQGRILRLMHGDGYTAKETAKQMGMTETAVKVSAHRAYKLLKSKLGQP